MPKLTYFMLGLLASSGSFAESGKICEKNFGGSAKIELIRGPLGFADTPMGESKPLYKAGVGPILGFRCVVESKECPQKMSLDRETKSCVSENLQISALCPEEIWQFPELKEHAKHLCRPKNAKTKN